jgi:hypothetical protein
LFYSRREPAIASPAPALPIGGKNHDPFLPFRNMPGQSRDRPFNFSLRLIV